MTRNPELALHFNPKKESDFLGSILMCKVGDLTEKKEEWGRIAAWGR
jgi:hypothetical protein